MSSTADEYRAVLENAGVLTRQDRGLVALAGADGKAFLHALLTNDIAALEPGHGCYAAYLTPQGRLITDMVVLNAGDRLFLDLPGEVASPLAVRLDQLIFSEDVQVVDLSRAAASLGIHGRTAASVLARALSHTGDAAQTAKDLEAVLEGLREYDNAWFAVRGQQMLVARSHDTGEPGFNLFVLSRETPLLEEVERALAAEGARAIGRATFDTLRIEAGRPVFGVDMDTETIPLEAGIEDRAISFTKGCYVGQEVIVRVLHRGHGRVARKLVGLVSADDTVAAVGGRVFSAETDIGRVTSAAFSPRLGHGVALGYVSREMSSPGTAVSVEHEGARVAATTAALPLIAPAMSESVPR